MYRISQSRNPAVALAGLRVRLVPKADIYREIAAQTGVILKIYPGHGLLQRAVRVVAGNRSHNHAGDAGNEAAQVGEIGRAVYVSRVTAVVEQKIPTSAELQ